MALDSPITSMPLRFLTREAAKDLFIFYDIAFRQRMEPGGRFAEQTAVDGTRRIYDVIEIGLFDYDQHPPLQTAFPVILVDHLNTIIVLEER